MDKEAGMAQDLSVLKEMAANAIILHLWIRREHDVTMDETIRRIALACSVTEARVREVVNGQ